MKSFRPLAFELIAESKLESFFLQLNKVDQKLKVYSALFGTASYIRPAQCDLIAQQLQALESSSTSICEQFNNPELVSSPLYSHRYLFLNDLYRIRRLAQELKGQVSQFRPICHHSTPERQKLQPEIHQGLNSLSSTLEKVKSDISSIRREYNVSVGLLEN